MLTKLQKNQKKLATIIKQLSGEAETLFPKEEYKAMARKLKEEIKYLLRTYPYMSNIEKDFNITHDVKYLSDVIMKFNPNESLLIVSCTKEKVWDIIPGAPDFVHARYAYKGKKFVKFLQQVEDEEIERHGFSWIILSAKYGFIEPWHPIMRYDEKFGESGDNQYFPISDESLRNQIKQKRPWRNISGEIELKRMIDFSKILTFNFPSEYIEKIRICFNEKEIHHYKMRVSDS